MTDPAARPQEPYEALARIYDYVMRHVTYDEWVAFVDSLLRRFDCRPRLLADLACGTGNATLEFDALGYAVEGVDGSAAMVRAATAKALNLGRDIRYHCSDLRDLGGLGPYDAAVCLYDSFNYLLEKDHVDQALTAVYGLLPAGGLFVFDVCTRQNSLRYFGDVRDEEQGPDFSYKRHSQYDADTHLQYNRFAIEFDGEHLSETHVQRIYALDELHQRIAASSFELLGAFDGFTFDDGSERSDRVHYVLRRPAV